MSSRPADIAPAHLATVWGILHKVLPSATAVWVFGSRATGNAHRSSDLDLALDAGRPLTRREEVELGVEFEESDLPYRVDIVDWRRVSDGFRKAVERDMAYLPECR